ncbi:MAG TPA: helix-turn-helix transcriptional regulator [Micromonosporaceae bacterium]|nr:helix-turn-helix transcriptional regulator [Micromonosporaceae bacterium]
MPSNVRDQIAAEVRAELARQQKTQRQAGEVLDLPQPSVQLRLKGERAFRAEELVKLAAWLGVPVEQFLPAPASAGHAQ